MAQLPEFLKWTKGASRAVKKAATAAGDESQPGATPPFVDPSEAALRVDPSEAALRVDPSEDSRGYRRLAPAIVQSYLNDPGRAAAPSRSLEDLGIPADAVELKKAPVVEGGRVVGYNAQEGVRPRRADPTSKLLDAARAPEEAPDERGAIAQTVYQQPTIKPPPGYDPETAETRPRWASELDQQQTHSAAARDAAEHPDRAHGWRRYVVPIIQAVMAGARTGDPVAALGAAGAGAVVGAVDPHAANRMRYNAEVARSDARLGQLRTQRKGELDAEHTQAETDYLRQRPGIEAGKRLDAQAKAEQSRIFRALGTLKGQKLDPANPRHAKLIADAEAAGIPIDAESFNNSKGNVIRYAKTDPEHPEQTVEVERNVVTGEETVLGQKGYQATRNAEGMTGAEVHTDADRDRAYAGLERERAVSNDLRRQGLAIANGHLTLAGQHFNLAQAQFDNRLSEGTRKELKSANDLAAEAERWQEAANAIGSRTQYKDPETGEMKDSRKAENQRDIFQARAESLRRRVVANYGYLFAPDDGGTPKMSAAQLQQLFPSVGGNWSGLATRLGVQLTDEGSGQGPVQPSTLPHRGAPTAAGHGAAAPGRYAGQRMPASNLPAAAKALGMSESAAKTYIEREGGVIY
jgi:hypothetical protein